MLFGWLLHDTNKASRPSLVQPPYLKGLGPPFVVNEHSIGMAAIIALASSTRAEVTYIKPH
ncbi:predicted protein [Sclerotinia sclerotiorum 1980 UF-70]|uniref:Uncharacterized protein n=1 Tax=Sclerotinia sclerotiorum (strain ATCC 18683 / 1980 / Ss-1) TaxID=665079 RepID=A7EQL9_SCLS1|nr:predicted protein [Sclerotinia sclerotiorum 1980 UF-70]EDN91761.1 predicted protein [Sclerotinia sclerotiorum 1980 UF-70]